MSVEIKAGHYYRRRDRKIVGPAKRINYPPENKVVWSVDCWYYGSSGIRWNRVGADPEKDLIEDLGPVDPRTLPVTESATIVPRGEAQQSQVGGSHYKDMVIQPFDYIHANGIPFAEGNVIKYVSRWRSKGGVEDLKKARHFLDMLIEKEEQSK